MTTKIVADSEKKSQSLKLNKELSTRIFSGLERLAWQDLFLKVRQGEKNGL